MHQPPSRDNELPLFIGDRKKLKNNSDQSESMFAYSIVMKLKAMLNPYKFIE